MTTDNIARADEIVGLTKRHDWGALIIQGWADDIRRGRYAKWLYDEAPKGALVPNDKWSVTSLAERVVAAHAAKHPQPSDGLPPGPWRSYKNGEHEYARLRAANARLRACCQAWEAWDKASYRYHDPDNFEDNLYADLRRTHDARDAARRAVDEAGDLKEPTSTPRLDAALADQAIESQTQGPDVPAPQTP